MTGPMKILVDLDALIDTRLATISRIDPAAAIHCLESEDYYFRTQDDFTELCGISQEQFADAYANRDLDTVRNSIMCPTAYVLKEILVGLELESKEHPLGRIPEVELNVYPYRVGADLARTLAASVGHYAGVETPVRVISRPHQDITFASLKSDYGAYMLYSFRDWVRHPLEREEYQKTAMPKVSVYAPSILQTAPPTEEQMEEAGLNRNLDPLKLIEVSFAPYLALDIMPTFMFCIYRPEQHARWVEQAYQRVIDPSTKDLAMTENSVNFAKEQDYIQKQQELKAEKP